jgi:uncharacterized protein YndB with AHSA1/START domain
MDTQPVIVERTFNASPERIWRALTNDKEVPQWYFDIKNFKAEPGFEFAFIFENEEMVYKHLCRIIDVIPEKKLAYTWKYEGHQGNSIVSFDLIPSGDKTTVRVTHTGIESFPDTGAFDKKNFIAGWTDIIGTSLKNYLEKNNPGTNEKTDKEGVSKSSASK